MSGARSRSGLYGATIRERAAALYRQGLAPVAIASRLGKRVSTVYAHLCLARQAGELPPRFSPEDTQITAAWRAPKRTQTADAQAGPREPGAHQGALPGGADSPRAASSGAAAEPPSGDIIFGKGTDRATVPAPARLPEGAAPTPACEPTGKTGGGAAPAGGRGGAFRGAADVAGIVDLDCWMAVSAPGEACRYHRGELACSRSLLGAAALRLAERGLVELVQRRHGAGDYSYLAIRRAPPGRRAAKRAAVA